MGRKHTGNAVTAARNHVQNTVANVKQPPSEVQAKVATPTPKTQPAKQEAKKQEVVAPVTVMPQTKVQQQVKAPQPAPQEKSAPLPQQPKSAPLPQAPINAAIQPQMAKTNPQQKAQEKAIQHQQMNVQHKNQKIMRNAQRDDKHLAREESFLGEMFALPLEWEKSLKPATPPARSRSPSEKKQQPARTKRQNNSTSEVFNLSGLFTEISTWASVPAVPPKVAGPRHKGANATSAVAAHKAPVQAKPATPVQAKPATPVQANPATPVQAKPATPNTPQQAQTKASAPVSKTAPIVQAAPIAKPVSAKPTVESNVWEQYYTPKSTSPVSSKPSQTKPNSAKSTADSGVDVKPPTKAQSPVKQTNHSGDLKPHIAPPKTAKNAEIFSFIKAEAPKPASPSSPTKKHEAPLDTFRFAMFDEPAGWATCAPVPPKKEAKKAAKNPELPKKK